MDDRLFRMMSASLYEPKPTVPQHLLEASRRNMNGADAAALVAQLPPLIIARVVDPKEMFK